MVAGGSPVLEQISFEVHGASTSAILGSRRAGKSTLLRLAAGIEAPDGGRIDFEGCDLARMPALHASGCCATGSGCWRAKTGVPPRASGSWISWRCRW